MTDTAAIREALDQIDRILSTSSTLGDEQIRGAVRAARRALDDTPAAAGTAEEAFGAILDTITSVTPIPTGLSGSIGSGVAARVNQAREEIIGKVGVGLADLHNRPQHTPDAVPPAPPPMDPRDQEWRRLQYIDRALKWAELQPNTADVLGLARQLEAYATGKDQP